MARRVTPGGLLPGTQTLPRIGNRIVKIEPLLGGIKQMHAPSVSVAMLRRREQVAVGRPGTDAGQHRHCALEEFVVQADPNSGQILIPVDDSRFRRSRLEYVVGAVHTHRYAQQVTQKFHDATTRAATNQRQRDDHLAQPRLGDHQLEQHLIVRRRRRESVVQRDAGLVRLLVDELAAHPMLGRQIANRLRSRQRPNGQIPTVSRWQPRRHPNTSIHSRTTN